MQKTHNGDEARNEKVNEIEGERGQPEYYWADSGETLEEGGSLAAFVHDEGGKGGAQKRQTQHQVERHQEARQCAVGKYYIKFFVLLYSLKLVLFKGSFS